MPCGRGYAIQKRAGSNGFLRGRKDPVLRRRQVLR